MKKNEKRFDKLTDEINELEREIKLLERADIFNSESGDGILASNILDKYIESDQWDSDIDEYLIANASEALVDDASINDYLLGNGYVECGNGKWSYDGEEYEGYYDTPAYAEVIDAIYKIKKAVIKLINDKIDKIQAQIDNMSDVE